MPRETTGPTESERIDYRKSSLLVPGQSSQKVGMGQTLYIESKAARQVFEQVNDALGFPLSDIMFHGPAGVLQETVNAQPAVYTLALATHEAIKEQLADQMIVPDSVAGHSVGAYATLPISGMLDIGEGAKLVRKRGELMQEASKTPGTMTAILGLNRSHLEFICAETGVELANINTEDQMVISGRVREIADALDFAHTFASREGLQIKIVPLKVSGAFHSELMKPAQQGLRDAIGKLNLKDPNVPIVANSSARPMTRAKEVEYELVNGLCLPVDWMGSVLFMAGQGTKAFIELGPRVLKSMVERIDPDLHALSVDTFDSVQKLVQSIRDPNPNPQTA